MAHQSPVSHLERQSRLAATLPEDIEGVLVAAAPDVRYLSGFTGSNGALLVGRDGRAVLATDGRYLLQAAAEAPGVAVCEARAVLPALVARAAQAGMRRVGIEAPHVSVAAFRAIERAAGPVRVTAVEPLVAPLRAVKDDAEIALLERACAITDGAFAQVLPRLRPGITEREVEWALREAMHEGGAEDVAFDSIVAFGPHSAVPHHRPTERPLAPADLVKLDFGARYAGYHADLTRTVVCGPTADWQRDLHAEVVAIQAQCREATRPGAVPSELDALAAALIRDTGHGVTHGLGHGVGLQIHEAPFLTAESTAPPLAAATAVTVEPGIYLEGRGGVRVEDTVVVTADGARSLTAAPRDLIEV